ncbi:MAG: GWxTD domain-containing protein [Acidobacteriota bacterium]
MRGRCCILASFLVWLAIPGVVAQRRADSQADYFARWLKQDAVYIITPEEKERFIEQFWQRRDLDPRTPANEFKEEHYRRIAYANERFGAGWPGWMTDRGKVYIIHGPPNEIAEYPSGGTYERPLNEGGGTTAAYPFEIWRYNHIPGFSHVVELQFVDRDSSGEYRLALSPEEKDAFLFVPNAGYTLAEQLGLSERSRRPYFNPGGSYPLMNYRVQDTPFARYETFVNIQRPRELKYKDLREAVDLRVTYHDLPFRSATHYFRLNDESCLIPITVELRHRDLTFKKNTMGGYEARVALYGVVTGLDNRIFWEFEDEMTASLSDQDYEQGVRKGSLYQRMILLRKDARYKLTLLVKDLHSSQIGSAEQALLPAFRGDQVLAASSLMVSDLVVPADPQARPDEMFLLGNVRVRPSLSMAFRAADYFAVYLQLYNVAVNPDTQNPSFRACYRIRQQARTVAEFTDESGETVQFFSSRRMVLIRRLPLDSLPPGEYTVEVSFEDLLQNQTVAANEPFTILAP